MIGRKPVKAPAAKRLTGRKPEAGQTAASRRKPPE